MSIENSDLNFPGGSHKGHRARLKKRFLSNGADSLETHELLELYLFYCVPRRNTNDIAHKMIEHFGSLENILRADVDELTRFDYISENGAILFKLVNELTRRCSLEKSESIFCYDTLDKVGRFLISLYSGETVEKLYLLLFDGRMKMLDCVLINEGTVGAVNICTRKIIEKVVSSKAVSVVLAHNHPGGLAVPSGDDIAATNQLESILACLDTKFLAHIIVAGDRYAPIKHISDGFC